jgi:WD40 repeat protein
LFEDNPQIAPVDRDVCKGYVGMQALNNLPKPPNAGGTWEPPLLLHGDFEGIKIYDSARGLLSGKRRAYMSLGEEHGQVTALVACKYVENPSDTDEKIPCCFLGYDSGAVVCLTVSLSEDESTYHFFVERHTTDGHSSKVSAMTIMSCKSNEDRQQPVLFTACYGGQVFYYPNAMNPMTDFDLKPSLAFSNSHPDLCPILSMTSSTFTNDNKISILVCTGDRDGSVRLWLAPNDLLSDTKPPSGGIFRQVKWYKSKGKHCVTKTKFINESVLVSGNNQGDIRIWDVEGIAENDDTVPGLTLRYFLKSAHNGPVETALSIGDVVVTSGGNDGNLVAWDATSGQRLGAVLCHYGQETFDESTGEKGTVKSCVMGATVVKKRLVSLCRDGALAEWYFREK